MEDSSEYEYKQSKIFHDFDKAYAEGKYNYLRELFLPYMLDNIADFYQFKKEKLKQFAEALDMHQLLKLYLYYKQMPLDMRRYMGPERIHPEGNPRDKQRTTSRRHRLDPRTCGTTPRCHRENAVHFFRENRKPGHSANRKSAGGL